MILNSGLNAACTTSSSASGAPATAAYLTFCAFIQYACFGTGSTTPAASDTSLNSQVGSRTNSRGGFNNSEAAAQDAANDVIWYEATFTRAFSIASNVNATEWGLAKGTTGDLSVRELFRTDPLDNGSSPITLTLEAGDELQLVITLRVQATWKYESKSFVITGTAGNDTAGKHTGNATVTAGYNTTPLEISRALSAAWPGGAESASYANLNVHTSTQSSVTRTDLLSGSPVTVTPTAAPYGAGNYYVDWAGTWGTSAANGDHYAWNAGAFGIGFRFILTDPVKLTKASTHKLTLTVRKSIARL